MGSSTGRPFWDSLPPEIRLWVLRCVVFEHGRIETTMTLEFGKASSLATVSREWQCFFEKETFRRMALTSSDLTTFSRVVRGKNAIRLNYINRIWLNVKLTKYTQRIYDRPESATNIGQNNRIFSCAIVTLLNALSSWEGIHGGLTLEIHAHSPGDHKYHPWVLELHGDYPLRFEEDLENCEGLLTYRRKKLEEIGIGTRPPDISVLREMAKRLRGTPLKIQPWPLKKRKFCKNPVQKLPSTPIVKGLVLRQAFFRGIALTSLATLFRESFVALESFLLERWTGITEEVESAFMDGLRTDLMPSLPASVQRFAFEHNMRFDSCESWPNESIIESQARLMAASCHRFTEFRPPRQFGYDEFLKQLVRGGRNKGSKLQHLILRVHWIMPTEKQSWVTGILVRAGRAAKNLPRLRILEMWNGGFGFGYLFRYTQDDSRATITWRFGGTDFVLEPKVLRTWARVASGRTLIVESIPFTAEDAGGSAFNHMTPVPHLALRRLAFDPISEAQVAAKMGLGR
ncbi:F-box domain-containing [Fusarium albosuccineum]|uniref:F-box domain-containing n=1 Tax=Fusarium albosuccineum TaxID=1237068 RepID=A0A8H4KKT0_9HYPO|nr:F-box domain-containing [Fusarium albosuccineum]